MAGHGEQDQQQAHDSATGEDLREGLLGAPQAADGGRTVLPGDGHRCNDDLCPNLFAGQRIPRRHGLRRRWRRRHQPSLPELLDHHAGPDRVRPREPNDDLRTPHHVDDELGVSPPPDRTARTHVHRVDPIERHGAPVEDDLVLGHLEREFSKSPGRFDPPKAGAEWETHAAFSGVDAGTPVDLALFPAKPAGWQRVSPFGLGSGSRPSPSGSRSIPRVPES